MARERAAQKERKVVEELHFRSDNAFLCLLLNRRTKFIRVIDFRAGAVPAKRLFIQSVAQREGVEKALIIVEKDEVSSWTRVGFVREGTIPGFYKRSDGHLVGCVIGDRTASIEISDSGQKLADRTINAGKKLAKDIRLPVTGCSVKPVSAAAACMARDAHWARGEALGCFDPFGRDAQRRFVEVSHRRGKPNYLHAEFQECFGHSLVEVLRPPRSSADLLAVVAGLNSVAEDLKQRGIVSTFALAPTDDVHMAAVYLAAGYRKTGLLASGVLVGDERKDAILWTRKLADPAGGEEIDIDEEEEEEDEEEEEEEEDEEEEEEDEEEE
jgi:hypothetical protein